MRNLWNDKQLHHRFQLVERESKVVLEESIEIHKVESAKYNGTAEAVRGASVLDAVGLLGQEGKAIGRVKTYQELLGYRVRTDEELSRMSTEQLTSTIAERQRRLQTRNG